MAILNSFKRRKLNIWKTYTWRIRLYSDNISPDYDLDPSTLTEITDPGYSPIQLTLSAIQEDLNEVYLEIINSPEFTYNRITSVYLAAVTMDDGVDEVIYNLVNPNITPLVSGSDPISIEGDIKIK